ncbi:MAG: MBL fold metallo-hydrolase [Oscillospiraceae bacterium]|jgi:metallo-beta-lactamase family protein|nr:MBL fold metallo-hydrolase [Oscillospiraceae bacterium]
MKLSFFGADQCVTGSCHCLEINGKRILIDCGLQQGRDDIGNQDLPFEAETIDYVLVTHAHIDHTGRIPLLVRQGFTGQIWTTRLTARLMEIMLIDSAHIQQSDAEYANRKNQRAGRPMVEPLYTIADAERVQGYVHTRRYGVPFELCEGVTVTFSDAGHLLGSSSITLDLVEDGVSKTVVFSGDIGNLNQPIIRDPVLLTRADYVVMESTYGDRNHQEVWSYTSELAKVIDRTLGRGGNVIIPAFAVGRTQELLYFLRRIKQEHLVKSVQDFPVYIDSPLASKATTIFCGDLAGYLDDEALALVKDGTNMFTFPGLRLTESLEESKMLNADMTPKVIISASGMCDAGRIRHHLKYNLWREECTVVFVGFQAPGTLGRTLLEGAETVRLFGEDVAVLAEIENFKGLSSHADRDHLLEWAQSFENPTHFFVVHGDREVAPYFAESLERLGLSAHAPQYTEVYDLIANCQLERGYLPERRPVVTTAGKESGTYQHLAAVGKLLQEVILRSKGRTNKDMARLADQIKHLIDKWEA